jgi:HSP20 family molecular chaperone IbpA
MNNPTIRVTIGSKAPDSAAPASARAEPPAEFPTFTPLIDIHEGPDGLVLEADLPGAVEQGLRIQLEDNILTLDAKVDSPAPAESRLLHQEYLVGDYQRSFILGDEVDRDRITAELTNGVLRLVLPRADRARTRRIEIKS